jgi:hypothetical protein
MKIVVHQHEMENVGVVVKRLNDGLGLLMVVIIYEFVMMMMMMMMTLYVNQVELE